MIADIVVDFESSLLTAQITVRASGVLTLMERAAALRHYQRCRKLKVGSISSMRGPTDANPKRAQIARGQAVFNSTNFSHRSCIVCHNTANNGTNIGNNLFDINTASVEARTPDLPLYTFRNKQTGEVRQLTDAGLGNITGRWAHLGLFKTPTLRGLAARAPYFHNGIAATLEDVVRHYENRFEFVFTDGERADLVAFLNAL